MITAEEDGDFGDGRTMAMWLDAREHISLRKLKDLAHPTWTAWFVAFVVRPQIPLTPARSNAYMDPTQRRRQE